MVQQNTSLAALQQNRSQAVSNPAPQPVTYRVPQPSVPDNSRDGLARHVLAGYLIVCAMVLMLFGWAANTQLAGAVVGSGIVIVENDEKLVQHPVGGVVGELLVKEGSSVREGEVLLRLSDTTVRSNLAVIVSDLSTLHARLARLKAERDGLEQITFPAAMTAAPTTDDLDAMRSETQFFLSRRLSTQNRKQQLERKIDQISQQAKAYDSIIASRLNEMTLVQTELVTARDMLGRQLATRMEKTNLEQTAARLEGDYGNALNQKATLEAQISETRLQISGLDHDMQNEVMKDLRDTEAKIAEDQSRRIAAEDQLQRMEIRAPADGVVHELAVHTVGGVVTPGEPIMKLVPATSPLMFQVRVNPTDIDQVHLGQTATLRLPAFSRSRTPELKGTVTLVGADITIDRQTGRGYYDVRITPQADMDARLKEKDIALVPGMPAEAFMETSERTTLSYLVKPFMDQVSHAFREE